MKWNTRITRKRSSVALAATASLLAAAPAAHADWLDVIAESITVTNVRTGQSGTTVTAQAGDSLQIVCTEWVGLSSGHDVWETKTVQRWENRVTVDGQSVAIFNPTIAAGTIIGSSTSSSGFLGLGGSHSKKGLADIRNAYPPVAWVAAAAGNHEASCVLNQPKQISDHILTNNVASALIIVAATPPATQANPPVSQLPLTTTGTVAEFAPTARQTSATPVASESNAGALTAATGIRALNGQSSNSAAPPNPCRMSVDYYIPEAPVLTTSGSALQVNDQLQIQCAFRKVTRYVEWPQCDDSARIAMQVLKGAQESGGRYSGIVSIDDSSVGVASSPEDGGNFRNIKLWKFEAPGAHEVLCQIDNAFRFAMEGEEIYLKAAISVDVSARSDGLTYRRFEPANVVPIRVRPTPSEAIPRLQGLTMESAPPAAGVLVIEAESLIAAAAVSGGQIVRQEMAGFGNGWGGNAQLFWRPPLPAGSKPNLLTEFILSSTGTYDLMLYYTTAPDFGQFIAYIDGSNPTSLDGYGPKVALRQSLLGRYQLASGRHELAFEVTGKNQQSTNYVVGVDRLQLTLVP